VSLSTSVVPVIDISMIYVISLTLHHDSSHLLNQRAPHRREKTARRSVIPVHLKPSRDVSVMLVAGSVAVRLSEAVWFIRGSSF
jgi:hypothetical protein